MYDTSILFYELNENQFISGSTINSMLENSKILAINGKYKKRGATAITTKSFNDNKSKYQRDDEFNKIYLDVDLLIAMLNFGIKFKS